MFVEQRTKGEHISSLVPHWFRILMIGYFGRGANPDNIANELMMMMNTSAMRCAQ